MYETEGPSKLLPAGATLSAVAALTESLPDVAGLAAGLAIAGGVCALAAWVVLFLGWHPVNARLGTRFLSILAMALAFGGLFDPVGEGVIGMLGVTGLFIAAADAGVEWYRGRPGPARHEGNARGEGSVSGEGRAGPI